MISVDSTPVAQIEFGSLSEQILYKDMLELKIIKILMKAHGPKSVGGKPIKLH